MPFEAGGAHTRWRCDLTPAMKMMMGWTSLFSPYELNPFDLNPLRVGDTHGGFRQLRRRSPVKLFIAATAANTGRLRLFRASTS